MLYQGTDPKYSFGLLILRCCEFQVGSRLYTFVYGAEINRLLPPSLHVHLGMYLVSAAAEWEKVDRLQAGSLANCPMKYFGVRGIMSRIIHGEDYEME